jgi:hypothetical protein
MSLQFVVDGFQFMAAALLLRVISICRASHHLLALAWMVLDQATSHRVLSKPRHHQSSKHRHHLSLKPGVAH